MANPQFSTTPPNITPRQDNSVEAQSIEEIDLVMRNENGYYVVDDLRLTEEQYKANFGTEEEMRQAAPDTWLWHEKVVPYEFHSSVTEDNRAKIKIALESLKKALVNCIEIR